MILFTIFLCYLEKSHLKILSNFSGYFLYFYIVLLLSFIIDKSSLGFSHFSLFTFQCTSRFVSLLSVRFAVSQKPYLIFSSAVWYLIIIAHFDIICQRLFEIFLNIFISNFFYHFLLIFFCQKNKKAK